MDLVRGRITTLLESSPHGLHAANNLLPKLVSTAYLLYIRALTFALGLREPEQKRSPIFHRPLPQSAYPSRRNRESQGPGKELENGYMHPSSGGAQVG